ncbi:sulfur carrier protein ThiS [uncultured Phascolarctobacterium sp.]|uniref:sulfur carrier protein ThiS n=1 Tax=uncultured Phascolarctobacterium sp. TaxID=512296 RepID=UPI0026009E41|nr:sulfur carrier protein ThiS [uncultured Phascolarctobacterium sp.]
MHINGEEKALACHTALNELLSQLGYRIELVAVELNGNIIKQADFGSTIITDADKLEIVSFVGGG